MSFLEWVQQTALAEWVSFSLNGYPIMITLHSIGLAIMVGISVALSLRMLGLFPKLPIDSLHGFFKWAWTGFIINTISGVALWTTQAVSYMQNTQFLIKIVGVFIGAALVGVLQRQMAGAGATWGEAVPPHIKAIAIVTIIVWAVAMVTGRLIAYL